MKRAFSLLEVMIALGIVGMLAASVFGFMLDLLRGREALDNASRDAIAAAVIVERLEGDLFVGVASAGGSAGVRGDDVSLRITGRSVRIPLSADERVIGDMIVTEIRFEEETGVLNGKRAEGQFEVISDRVRLCRFRYFDGRAWNTSFDSSQVGALPVAIEIAAWFGEIELDEDESAFDSLPDDIPAEAFRGAPSEFGGSFDDEPPTVPTREPDLLRVMIVPDGPIAGWEDG